MKKNIAFITGIIILTGANLFLALTGNVYPPDETWFFFGLIEAAIIFSIFLIISGHFILLCVLYTIPNAILLAAEESYSLPFFLVAQAIAVVYLIIGIIKIINEETAEEVENKKRLERMKRLQREGKETIATITNTRQTGYSKSQTRCTYDLSLTVKAAPPGVDPFSSDVATSADFYDMSRFRPGTKVKIRYLPDDPTVCRFIQIVDTTMSASAQPVKTAQPVSCCYCHTRFDLTDTSKCPNCRAPYAGVN